MADEPNHPFAAWGHGSAPAPVTATATPATAAAAPPAREAAATAQPPAANQHVHRHAHVTTPRLILTAVLAAGVAVAVVLLVGGGSSAPALARLRAAAFATAVPAGYVLTRSHPLPGFDNLQLMGRTNGRPLPLANAGVPPAGMIELTLSEVPVSVATAATHDRSLATLPPLRLLGLLVDRPSGATHVVTTVPLHTTMLAGTPAAAITYAYRYHGVRNLQSDIVTRHGTELIGIELDSEPALAGAGHAAVATVLSNWSWNVLVGAG